MCGASGTPPPTYKVSDAGATRHAPLAGRADMESASTKWRETGRGGNLLLLVLLQNLLDLRQIGGKIDPLLAGGGGEAGFDHVI